MDSVTLELDSANAEELFRQFTVSPLHEFTMKFVGTLKDETPAIDLDKPGMRDRLMHATLEPIEEEGCGLCDESGVCTACGADQSDPGPFRTDAFLSIKVSERSDAPGLFTAEADDFTSEYGSGESPYEALQDFFGRVADHMAFLVKYESILTDSLSSELDYFRYISGHYDCARV